MKTFVSTHQSVLLSQDRTTKMSNLKAASNHIWGGHWLFPRACERDQHPKLIL